jgi:gluconolactonase
MGEAVLHNATGWMIGRAVAAALALLFASGAGAAEAPPGSIPVEPEVTFRRVDPRLDRLIPREAVAERVVEGFHWVEGPLWDRAEGRLLFSDIPANSVFAWKEGVGTTRVIHPSGYTGKASFTGREPGSNGLTFDPDGRLVMCQHGDRRIVRVEPDGGWTTLVDRYRGRRIHSPNDAVFARDGSLYFTDPPFGLPNAHRDPGRELDFQGVYRRSLRGEVTLLTKELSAPNGIAFAPDGRTLYVSNADAKRPVWMAYPVKEDGTLAPGRVFFDATPWTKDHPGFPDGMKTDAEGNLFASGPGGLHVFAPDGTHLGSILTGRLTSNAAWGGPDGSHLFITADTTILRIQTATRGPGW